MLHIIDVSLNFSTHMLCQMKIIEINSQFKIDNFTFLGSKTINACGNVTAAKSISLQISRFKWIDLEQYQLSSRFISTWIDGTKFSGMLFLRFFNHIPKPFKFKCIKIKSANKSANLNTYSNSIFIQSIIIKDDTLLQQGKV